MVQRAAETHALQAVLSFLCIDLPTSGMCTDRSMSFHVTNNCQLCILCIVNLFDGSRLELSSCFIALQCIACCTLIPTQSLAHYTSQTCMSMPAIRSNPGYLFLQMLDRYVQDSTDNALPSSHDGSEASDTEDDEEEAETSSTVSGSSSDVDGNQLQLSGQQQLEDASHESAHLERLRLGHEQALQSSTGAAPAEHLDRVHTSDWQTSSDSRDGHIDRSDELHEHADRDSPVECNAPEQLPVDLPDHVAVRRRGEGTGVLLQNDAQDLDESSTMSHANQIPSQQAVKQRVVDQQRSRMRRQVLARASRNAQKVGNKKERKQTASSMTW